MPSSRSSSARPSPARRETAFILAAGVVLWYAIPDGSYDMVTRHSDAVALWWVVGLGAALALLPRAVLEPVSAWVLVPLAALVAWTALGLLWTNSDERTLAEVVRVLHYAGIVLLVWLAVSATTWRPAAAGVLAAAIVVCGLAVASRLAPDQLPDEVAKGIGTKRLSYPLGYWNAVGAWGAMTVAMALVWSAHARTVVVRAVTLAGTPLAASAVYLSYSRAGLGGVVVAVLAALALSVNRWTVAAHAAVAAMASAGVILVIRDRPEIADGAGGAGAAAVLAALVAAAVACALAPVLTRRLEADRRWRLPAVAASVGAAALAVVLLLALATVGRAPISDAWDDFRNTSVVPTPDRELPDPAVRLTSLEGARYEIWSSALRAFRDHPVKGIGPGTFEFHWNQEDGGLFVRDAHSLYFEQAAELGLPGILLTLAVLLGLAVLGVRASRGLRDPSRAGAAAAMSAAFLVFLFHAGIDWMWEATAVTVLGLGAGTLAAASAARRRRRGGPGWRPRAALVAVALVACAVSLPGLLSTTKLRASRDAYRDGRDARALELAGSAVARQPWAAEPYAQRALIRWASGDLARAGRDLQKARDREPGNWRYPLLTARLEVDRGRGAAAVRAFRDARRLRPSSPFLAPGVPVPAGEPAPPPGG